MAIGDPAMGAIKGRAITHENCALEKTRRGVGPSRRGRGAVDYGNAGFGLARQNKLRMHISTRR